MTGLQQTSFFLTQKKSVHDNIPLHLRTITFNNIEIKREPIIKFLGVIIDENNIQNKHM